MGGRSGALPAQGPAQAGSAGEGDTSRRVWDVTREGNSSRALPSPWKKILPHGEVELVFCFLAIPGKGLAPSWHPLEMFRLLRSPLSLFLSFSTQVCLCTSFVTHLSQTHPNQGIPLLAATSPPVKSQPKTSNLPLSPHQPLQNNPKAARAGSLSSECTWR